MHGNTLILSNSFALVILAVPVRGGSCVRSQAQRTLNVPAPRLLLAFNLNKSPEECVYLVLMMSSPLYPFLNLQDTIPGVSQVEIQPVVRSKNIYIYLLVVGRYRR